jgi:hypothetical protein
MDGADATRRAAVARRLAAVDVERDMIGLGEKTAAEGLRLWVRAMGW